MLPDINKRIAAFSTLGSHFRMVAQALGQQDPELLQSKAARALYEKALESPHHNPWFTTGNVSQALDALAGMLTPDNLSKWCSAYPELWSPSAPAPKSVAVIMAGNIPLVGFHDFLSVLISGHGIMARLSAQDKHLPKAVGDLLIETEPAFTPYITFSEAIISGFDAVIATGSNNSARYFDYYFGKYPHIIRANRTSMGILTGSETQQELEALGRDVFSYFGLGCRNISMLAIPEQFDLARLHQAWSPFSEIVNHSRYGNNYDYQKAVLLINNNPFTDTGFCLLRHSSSLASPVSVIHLLTYNDSEHLEQYLEEHRSQIQCVAASGSLQIKAADPVPFGKSQQPELWDYADGVDTMRFLSGLHAKAE
ncbi:MAG: hypothetical protein R6U64_06765 [Bacteroidales bacterium]